MNRWDYYGNEWRKIRSAALERDRRRCRLSYYPINGKCANGPLEVHHGDVSQSLRRRLYELAKKGDVQGIREILDNRPDLFPTLCRRHHDLAEEESPEWVDAQLRYVEERQMQERMEVTRR